MAWMAGCLFSARVGRGSWARGSTVGLGKLRQGEGKKCLGGMEGGLASATAWLSRLPVDSEPWGVLPPRPAQGRRRGAESSCGTGELGGCEEGESSLSGLSCALHGVGSRRAYPSRGVPESTA